MHDDDGDETLTQDPLTEETSRVRRRGPGRIISTVSPTRLTPADYMDISNLESAQCSLKHHASSSSSTRRSTAPRFRLFPTGFKRDVFPPDTHGFLYYDQDPRTPPLARELRFRVTSGPDPSLFASGHDLCCDNGLPYRIPLLNIASTHRCYSVVKQNLVKDGLVSPKIMRKASAQFPVRATRILHSFGQPFLLAFGTYMQNLHLVGWDVIRHISFRQILCIQRVTPSMIIRETDHPRPSPHTPHRLVTGSAICCFEKSTLPKHAGRRVVVCRVLRIVDPIEPSPVVRVPQQMIPCEGELMRMTVREVKEPCWYVDVDSGMSSTKLPTRQLAKSLRILYDNEARAKDLTAH